MPSDIQLMPLGRHKEITAQQLISDLKTEALKQKQKTKRNPFKTGLYKYVLVIRVEVWEIKKNCGYVTRKQESVFTSFFKFSQTFTSVTIHVTILFILQK